MAERRSPIPMPKSPAEVGLEDQAQTSGHRLVLSSSVYKYASVARPLAHRFALPKGRGLGFWSYPLPGERVAATGAFTSCRGPGEGLSARVGNVTFVRL